MKERKKDRTSLTRGADCVGFPALVVVIIESKQPKKSFLTIIFIKTRKNEKNINDSHFDNICINGLYN